MSTFALLGFIIGLLLVIGIVYFATQDASKRGLSETQVFLLRVLSVVTFPVVLIIFLILRPSLREKKTA